MDHGNPLDDEEWYVVFINPPSTRYPRTTETQRWEDVLKLVASMMWALWGGLLLWGGKL